MKSRVTQRDVAKKAGVSHMTVSLALRSHPSIPEGTREMILRVCRELGYVPDPMLSSLSAYRAAKRPPAYQSNLGWITMWPQSEAPGVKDSEFEIYFSAASERAREHGYSLERIRLPDIEFNTKRLQKILHARGVMGIALPPAPWPRAELEIDYSRVSAVRFGFSYRYPHLHTLVNAQFHTALQAVQEVLQAGYVRLGIILTRDQDERTSWNFLGGYMAAQNSIPRKNRISPFYPREGDVAEIEQWARRNELDAVIGLGHAEVVAATGLPLGYADLSVSVADEHLSGMCQNPGQLGIAAIDLLTSMIHRGETGVPAAPLLLCVYSSWRPGRTLPILY